MPDVLDSTPISSADHYRNMQLEAAAQRASSTKDQSLGMQDFIKLLVAQLQNQDMMNPMSDREFIAQMAQFSNVQAISDLKELNMTAYAVSMIGKEVKASFWDPVKEKLSTSEGVVTGVTLFEGKPKFFLEGSDVSIDFANIMTVGAFKKADAKPPADPDPDAPPAGTDKVFGMIAGTKWLSDPPDADPRYRINADTGEVFKYDPVTGNWTKEDGKTYELIPGTKWLLDSATGHRIDKETGDVYAPSADFVKTGQVYEVDSGPIKWLTDPPDADPRYRIDAGTGEVFKYDPVTGSWAKEDGKMYELILGTKWLRDPATGHRIDKETGDVYAPSDEFVKTGAVYRMDIEGTKWLIDPETEERIDMNTGEVYRYNAGIEAYVKTGEVYERYKVDTNMWWLVEPKTGWLIDPSSLGLIDPKTLTGSNP